MDDVIAANMLYGSSIGDYRSTGNWNDGDQISKVDVGSKDMDSFAQDLTESENLEPDGGFQKKAGASFDSVFSPYSTYFSNPASGLPNFEVPINKLDPNSLTLNPFNPNNSLSLYYAPTGSELYQSSLAYSGFPLPSELGFSQVDTNSRIGKERGDLRKGSPSGWMESGHSIQMAVNGTGNRYSTDFDYQFTESSGVDVEVTDIRAVGFRGPMVLSGWGFDTDGKPVPADPENPRVFAPGAFSNPSLFKTGPIDLRWDNERKVWGGFPETYLVKMTNTYNPSCFSYEVQRSNSRSQYTRDTLGSRPLGLNDPIHDPEQVAYDANPDNFGCFERLDFDGLEYPHYEAFIIRQTNEDPTDARYYNLFTDDCQDCGHITSYCTSGCSPSSLTDGEKAFTRHGSSSINKKILIENPLRQSLNVGDLAFTVKTGRSKKVNTGSFSGGTGAGAVGTLTTDVSGVMTANLTSGGTGYTYGAFVIITGNIATNVSLTHAGGVVTNMTASPLTGYRADETYTITFYPTDTVAVTEKLDIHWIQQAEFKSQQVTTHVEGNGGILQTCSTLIQTQGFKSCEQCGEDLTLVNSSL
jgi:hypothetical protein